MDSCDEKDKQIENQSNRKRQNLDLPLDDRIYYKKTIFDENGQRLLNAEITQNEAQSITMLCDLPLEVLDIVLQKSYLHWLLNSSTKQSDKEIIRSLISVDVCFNQRITRRRFKKAIWFYLKDFYGKTKKIHAIISNNRNYLEKNIQPNDELLASLLSFNCLTQEQSHFIQRQRSTREKNNELLYIMESFDETKVSTFINCLRRTNQKTVAKIIENGGVVLKIQVQARGAKCAMETYLHLHKTINDLQNRTKPRSHKTDKLIAQLREEGLEILNSQLDGQTEDVWIRCHSQTAIEKLHMLYESNELRDEYFENIQPSSSRVINIDKNQFKKTVVVSHITSKFTQRIKLQANKWARGVTKLRNEIYILSYSDDPIPNKVGLIRVFGDRNPFRLQTVFETKRIKHPNDIVSSEKDNCLYVSDGREKCVWKITRETDYQYKIIEWLTIDYVPGTLSVSGDGELLIKSNYLTHSLMIYGSDAKLIRSISLTRDIKYLAHAVESSIGNFIIIHMQTDGEQEEDKDEDEHEDDDEHEYKDEEAEDEEGMKLVVSVLTRDGQMVIRRFTPSDETQELIDCTYLLIDSNDRVFVADHVDNRVILLDSDLKWNRILCPTKEDDEEPIPIGRWRLFYDEETKQLFVGGHEGNQINVYTLSRY